MSGRSTPGARTPVTLGPRTPSGARSVAEAGGKFDELNLRYQELLKEHGDYKAEAEGCFKEREKEIEEHARIFLQQHHKAHIGLILNGEASVRAAIQLEEDEVFLALYGSLNHARRCDASLQRARNENSKTLELLEASREREGEIQHRMRDKEVEVTALLEKVRQVASDRDKLQRQVSHQERKATADETRHRMERIETGGRVSRLEGQIAELKEERDMLLNERAALIREKERLLEIQAHSSEREQVVHQYKEAHQTLQHQLAAVQQELQQTRAERAAAQKLVQKNESTEEARKDEHNRLAATLRHEVSILEKTLRESEAEKEKKLHADMEAMLQMQSSAMDRDAMLLQVREEFVQLQAAYDSVQQDKDIIMNKLVAERETVESLLQELHTATGKKKDSFLINTASFYTHLPAKNPASMKLKSTASQTDFVLPGTTGVASTGERTTNASDLVSDVHVDDNCATQLSLDGLKKCIVRYSEEATSMRVQLQRKTVTISTLREVLHKRLQSEMQELEWVEKKESDGEKEKLNFSLEEQERELNRITQTSSAITTPASPDPVSHSVTKRRDGPPLEFSELQPSTSPQPVDGAYKKTESDLMSLRKKVADLRNLQKQMDTGIRLISKPAVISTIPTVNDRGAGLLSPPQRSCSLSTALGESVTPVYRGSSLPAHLSRQSSSVPPSLSPAIGSSPC